MGNGNSIWAREHIKIGYYRKDGQSEWTKIFDRDTAVGTGKIDEEYFDQYMSFAGFSNDPNHIYVIATDDKNKLSLYLYDVIENQKIEKIASHEKYDITGVSFDRDYNLEAYFVNVDKPQFFPVSDKAKKVKKVFDQNFPGSTITIESVSENRDKYVFKISSSTDPGSFYLLDFNSNQMNLLGYNYRSLDVEKLSEQVGIKYTARDGLEIPGFITVPDENKNKPSPLVVLVRPSAIGKTTWGFDWWVQFLASRGYSVLQVNQRGSNGYGVDFLTAGFFELGGKMLEDINDGAKWAIQNGYAKKDKVCVMGRGNFGGYAAIQSPIIEKGLYNCSVAYDPMINFKDYVRSLDSTYIEKKGMDIDGMSPYLRRDEFDIPILMFKTQSGVVQNGNRYDRFFNALEENNIENSIVDLRQEASPDVVFLNELEAFLEKHLKN
ncbi:alpha/beta hydrolase family protein [Pseudemcibacter aquimaris]|uniref:alpha/beta hydrolase family protein n=1 Tax=Pseudemcibacter aquimaris TaxID=2857064 RepID=UPI002010DEFD|nr:prolyl oligopeptidase family serine peptidase [Pseudemcibacter aquimaris]MCC3859747.1 prolyl oligopeptidase family serine peptidase [Pseudemcibacter aquimaris]WDU60141.1 prolyl oligopeptidase family serine peptidase [Pseudemcibacter aquimaris]